MAATVESLCNALVKSKLLPPNDVKALYQRWRAEAKDAAASTERFTRWLVMRQYVTEYQANLLTKGQVDNFFLNDYKILDRIGAGRMAGIFKAIHSRLGTVVAVKVLPPSKAKNLEMFSRFQREARMSMKLKHANVVRTFQVGESRGLNYIVMEYLEGETLEETLKKRGKLSVIEAVRVVYQALHGLQHIFEQGLVHRDLKPANLMLTPMPRPDTTVNCTVKILDIGLGRVMFDEDVAPGLEQVQLTTDGAMLGAPEYMAPEQARDAHGADIRADIYTLGSVLYHCLAGQSPFADVNVVRMMVRHATEIAKPLREVNPQVPEGLAQIVSVMLAKDPNQRLQTPDLAWQALKVFLTSGHEAARPLEADPQMKIYLDWLASQPTQADMVAAAVSMSAGVKPLSPGGPRSGIQRGAPAAIAPAPRSGIQRGGPSPVAAPAMPAPVPALTASAPDVELVQDGTPPETSMGRKDVLLLGIIVGIALVLVAGGLAFFLNIFFRKG